MSLDTKSLQVINKTPLVRRNQPCPCGSEAKFKQCCYRMRQAREVMVIVHRLGGESKRKGGAS